MKLLWFNRKVLSIDFGSSQIKIIEGRVSKKGIEIFNAISIGLPNYVYSNGEILNKKIIIDLLKNALKENKISTELVYGVINSSSIITRNISIPKVDEKEIASIIGFQIEDFFPVDPEDYVIDYIVLDEIIEEDINKINILIIGISEIMVLDHLNLIKEAGLKPGILDFQGNTIVKLLNFTNTINDYYITKEITIGSIDMGYENTKVTIIKKGEIKVTRVIDIGSNMLYENISLVLDYSIEDAKDMIINIKEINIKKEEFTDYNKVINILKTIMESIFKEIKIIFRYYKSRNINNNINLILLQGGLSNINGLDNLYFNFFNITTINLISLNKIELDGKLSEYSNSIGGLIRKNEV